MKQLELVEIIQQHHPMMGHTQIRKALNRAQDDYCANTELMKKRYIQSSTAGKRYYELTNRILTILKVQINDVDIPRLIGSTVIDDDEFDASVGLTAPSTSSNERYWYINNDRVGIVEKVKSAITRDGKTSDYQSISETGKEIRLYTIDYAGDFTEALDFESELPLQFHEGLTHKVIADEYLKSSGAEVNINAHKMFWIKYNESIKEGRKYARGRHHQTGFIKPTDF